MLTRWSVGVAFIVLLLLCGNSLASTFHFDVGRSGNFTDYGPIKNEILWKANLTGLVDGSPVVWDGRVYVSNWYGWGSWNPGLYCINATTGEIIWVNGNITGASTAAIHDGTLFIGSLSGKLYAVNALNGSIVWEKQLENNPEWWGIASSPLVYNGTVYVTTFSNGALHALDLNGNELWNITTGNKTSQYSSPSAYNGKIFFAGNSSSNAIYSVNESGNVEWSFPVEGKIVNTPSIGYGKVFFATETKLYALSLDGSEAWNISFNGTISSPAIAYGKIFIGSREGKLYCFNASNGQKIWEFDANGKIYSSPAIADGMVYFATNTPNGTIYAVYAENGTLLWAYALNPPEGKYYNIMSSPFIYEGKLYIGADDGNLYAFGHNPILWKGDISLSPGKVQITLKDGNTTEIDGLSALAALWKASQAGNFSVEIVNSSWGLYVESITGIKPEGLSGWMYWVNYPAEPMPSVGVGDYKLKNGDQVVFYYGSYDPATWEPTKPNESDYIISINISVSNIIWEGTVTLQPGEINVSLKDGGYTSINGMSALAALWKASQLGNLNVSIMNTSWGLYVESVGNIPPNNTYYWLYWVNYPDEAVPSVGAASYLVGDGDDVIFYYGYYNTTTWEPSTPDKSPYIVKIHVNLVGGAYITGLNVNSASRGGFANATVNVTGLQDGWYVIVVSGTNSNGDSIAGISTVQLTAGESISVPVIIPIPQQVQTGNYRLYAGIYSLSDYPENVEHIFGGVECEVS